MKVNFLFLLVCIQINLSLYSQGLNKYGGSETNPDNILDNTGALGTGKGATSNGKITFFKDGKTRERAASSALKIKQDYPAYPDGVYWIDLPIVGPTQTYCLMNVKYNGGGWMLALKATTGTTFNYDADFWTTANTLNATDITLTEGDAKYEVMNRYAAKDMMALWPDINNISGESGSIDGLSQWSWLQNNFSSGSVTNLIDLFQTSNNFFISDAATFSGKGEVFSSQIDVRFYGFNYTGKADSRIRWGFAWNENGGGLYPDGNQETNDVSGGLGMDTYFGNYSSGDIVNCCENNLGINRSARVELYIR